MYIDKLLQVSAQQALTATAYSTNSVDLGNVTPKRRVADGEPLAWMLTVDVAADHTSGDETYEVDVIQSANADLSSETVLAKYVILYSTLTAGAKIVLPLPPGNVGVAAARYIGLKYVLGGTTPTVTVTAELMPLSDAVEVYLAYAKGYTIS